MRTSREQTYLIRRQLRSLIRPASHPLPRSRCQLNRPDPRNATKSQIPTYMKPPLCSSLLKARLLIIPLALCFGSSSVAQTGGKDLLSPRPVRPGNLDDRTELPQGYLKVYSATDEFNDGDAWY